jgi:hypothetical protein
MDPTERLPPVAAPNLADTDRHQAVTAPDGFGEYDGLIYEVKWP